jgi:hypothetical protein
MSLLEMIAMVVPSKIANALIHVPVTRANLRKSRHLIHVQFEINLIAAVEKKVDRIVLQTFLALSQTVD